AGERAQIGVHEGLTGGHATGVGMLDDRAGRTFRRIELGDQLERRIGVEDVDVAELSPLQLLRCRHAVALLAPNIERAYLVGVLAIAKLLFQATREGAPARRFLVAALRKLGREPVRYLGVVSRRTRVGDLRKFAP